MTSGNGTGLNLSMAECVAELKAFRHVLENVETTNRTVLNKLETKERQSKVVEENRKRVTELGVRGDQLLQKLSDGGNSLHNLTDTVSSLCEKVDGLLKDYSSMKHTSRPSRRIKQVINTERSNDSVQDLNIHTSSHKHSSNSRETTTCDNDIRYSDIAGIPPVTINSRGYKRRLTDDNSDNRLNYRRQSNVRTSQQTVTQNKPDNIHVGRQLAVEQRSRHPNTGASLDTSLALRRKLGGNSQSGQPGSTEMSKIPGLDVDDERRIAGLKNNSFIAFQIFQKWFTYAETEKVIGSVSGLVRGRGPDTVLCLDTSASMEGEPFRKMMEFAIDFVTGVEALKDLINIEENISVTTIGEVTKVWIHMTSDYSAVKATLHKIHALGPRGRSPLAGGLLVALAGCLGNGQDMTVGDVKISPRIVLVSDGKGTPDHIKYGPDMTEDNSVNTPEKLTVDANLKAVCDNLKRRHHKVYCIPVGEADQSVLEKITKSTSGKVFLPTRLDRFLRTMDKTLAAAQLLARVVVTLGYIPPDDGMQILFERQHLPGQLTAEDTAEVLEQTKIFVDELPEPLIATELDDGLPPLGTRVRRGPGWKSNDQDSMGVGTIGTHGKNGKVWVEWDNRQIHAYDYKSETKEIKTVNEPRVLKSDELIAPGCRVTRADIWPYGDEDGGPGSVGVVVRVNLNGTVIVRWPNKRLSNLKYGHEGEFEVKVCAEDSCLFPVGQENQSAMQSNSIYIESVLPSIGEMNRRNRPNEQ